MGGKDLEFHLSSLQESGNDVNTEPYCAALGPGHILESRKLRSLDRAKDFKRQLACDCGL